MPGQQQQSGFALLLFMIVMIGFITAGFSGLLTSSVKQQNEQAKIKTRQALLQAKEALLSYAVDYKIQNDFDQMGKLPCPDVSSGTNFEGSQDASCGATSVNAIGFFPFKSVGLGKIEDANGECLWYVVSGDYKNAPAANMLNWDSVGYLNVVDENGNLKHGSSEDDFPIALIISPGKALNGQDRTPVTALTKCHANFNAANYLEGGVNIDYSTDHPTTADTLWSFLSTSESTYLDSSDHNDQIIPIYRSELWNRVAELNDLDTSNTSSLTYQMTMKLATCLESYASDPSNTNNNLPYPAVLSVADIKDSSLYVDEAGRRYGRFPQDITVSDSILSIVTNDDELVTNGSGGGYCGLNTDEEKFWEKWKNQFYYIVADDFLPNNSAAYASKCTTPGKCLEIIGNSVDKFAAIVFFAQPKSLNQTNRSLVGLTLDSDIWNQFLDGANQTLYAATDLTNDFSNSENDFAVCLKKELSGLSVGTC